MSFAYYNQFDTPCYIFDHEEFERSIIGFSNALRAKFKHFTIGYSFKTNSLPYAIETSKKLGCLAEVVSSDEYELAKQCGYKANEIIYNGPMKSRETFLEAINAGAVVNIETKRELDWLECVDCNSQVKVGLRLNINLDIVNPDEVSNHDGLSRFGFSDETSEFADALNRIATLPNVTLAGIHTHRSTATRSVKHYIRTIEYASQVIKKYNLELEYFDVGGGFFGIFPNKPTYDDYAEAMYSTLANYNLQHLNIIIEPGCAILASAFKFVTRVIDTKRVDDNTVFVTTDGSRNDVDPLFRKSSYLKDIFLVDEDRSNVAAQVISGCSCMEDDRLFSMVNSPELKQDDIIVYNNVGAYTMTLSPNFIRFMPRVYAIDCKTNLINEVRRAGNARDIIMN